jgi:hypothetical protein
MTDSAGGLTAGIDWASADHVACVVDAAGQARDRFSVTHDRAGIRKLVTRLRAAGAGEVAIKRSDGVLVDALLDAGLAVVVITSRQKKNLRSRYGSAGAKDDRFDAFVLADVLRTDRSRLRPLAPDAPANRARWTQGSWHLLSDPSARFRDLGPDWHDRSGDRDRKIRAHLRQLQALGLDVTLTPAAA